MLLAFRASMANYQWTLEIKRLVIVVILVKHKVVDIFARVLELAKSFVQKELEASSGNVPTPTWMCRLSRSAKRIRVFCAVSKHSNSNLWCRKWGPLQEVSRTQAVIYCMRIFGTCHDWQRKGIYIGAHTRKKYCSD